jgi:hypothetical protein
VYLPAVLWGGGQTPKLKGVEISVADPDANPDPTPDYYPPDQQFFGFPASGSGFISQRYGSGFGSFYHLPKIVRKTLNFTSFLVFMFEK